MRSSKSEGLADCRIHTAAITLSRPRTAMGMATKPETRETGRSLVPMCRTNQASTKQENQLDKAPASQAAKLAR